MHSKPLYFLSDLHLPVGASPLRDAFLEFLRGLAREAREVYILGDLFEYWVGDDVGLDDYHPECAALRRLSGTGVDIYFQHGNRDFLVGREFSDVTNVQLLDENHCLQLDSEKVLLAHGDQYCTDDVSYQRWRRFARSQDIQLVFQWLPQAVRQWIAGGVRRESASRKSSMPTPIMDVNADAIVSAFQASGADRLIHGHTHRPHDHRYDVAGKPRVRTVLADWRPGVYEVLRFDAAGFERVRLKPASSA